MDKSPTLLGLIDAGSSYGYDLKQRYDSLFGGPRPIAYGQIYASLARMIRDGLIVALGVEAGDGPDRKRYEITPEGRRHLHAWLATPDTPSPDLQSNLFAKTVLALLLDAEAPELLDAQRASHLGRMRDLTTRRREASLLDSLAIDHALFHIEADLRWIDLTEARLGELRKAVTSGE